MYFICGSNYTNHAFVYYFFVNRGLRMSTHYKKLYVVWSINSGMHQQQFQLTVISGEAEKCREFLQKDPGV